MKASIILSFLASGIALAAPVSDIQKRADTSVYICNDREFKGHCEDRHSASQKCVNLGSDFNDQVSSVGPDKGSFCYFFVNKDCDSNGDFFHVGNPGVADLSKTPVNGPEGSTRNFEDKISSYRCTPDS